MYTPATLLALAALASVSIAYPLSLARETKAMAAIRRAAVINFGNCSDPEIQDINGIFSVVNTKDFGSVQPSKFLDDVTTAVCNVLATNCGAENGITNGDCSTAASDAIGVGNTAAADDEFNSVLGITTDFASTAVAPPAASSAVVTTKTTTTAAKETTTAAAAKETNGAVTKARPKKTDGKKTN